MNYRKVSLRNFGKLIRLAASIRKPLFGFGPPGIGKTEVVKQIVQEYLQRSHYYEQAYSLVDLGCEGGETVFGAYGYEESGDTEFPTSFAFSPSQRLITMRRGYESEDGNKLYPVLHFDEMTCPPPELVPGINSLMQHAKYGPLSLPPETLRVGTGNREVDAHTVFNFTPITANRGMIVEVFTPATDWIEDYAGPNNLHPWAVAYAASLGDAAFNYDPQRYVNCTPRSLKTVSDSLYAMRVDPARTEFKDNKACISGIQMEAIASAIGMDATHAMLAIALNVNKIPTWDEVKANPTGVAAPDITDPLACYLSAMQCAISPANVTELNIGLRYLLRLPTNSMILAMAMLKSKNSKFSHRELAQCGNYLKVQAKHSDMLATQLTGQSLGMYDEHDEFFNE